MIHIEELIALNEKVVIFVNNLSVILLILVVGFIIGKLSEKLSLLLIRNSNFRRIRMFSMRLNAEKTLPIIIRYLIYVLTIVFALIYAKIIDFILVGLAVIIVIAIVFTLLHSIKESLPNLIANSKLKRDRKFKLRKKIEIDGLVGEVSKVGLSEIKIITKAGDEIHIPCKLFIKKGYEVLE